MNALSVNIKKLVIAGSSVTVIAFIVGGLLAYQEQLTCLINPQLCETTKDLNIRVFAEDGQPIEKVKISIDAEGEQPIYVLTDSDGFTTANVPRNKAIHIIASKKDYGIVSRTFSPGSVITEQLILDKKEEASIAPLPSPTSSLPSPISSPSVNSNSSNKNRINVGFLFKDLDRKPIVETQVEFVFDGGKPLFKTTDTDGYLEINLTPRNSVKINIRKDGYERLERVVDISNPAIIQEIYLKKTNEISSGREPGITPIEKEKYVNPRGHLENTKSCKDCDLVGKDLSGLDLMRANLEGARLTNANLSKSNLTEAILKNAVLTNANLKSANLTGADLTGANLNSANLDYTNFADADLTGANLQNVESWRTNICGATLPDGTIKKDCD